MQFKSFNCPSHHGISALCMCTVGVIDWFATLSLANRDFMRNTTATATATRTLSDKRINDQMIMYMRYNSWYISFPNSAKKQREIPNSALSGEREPQRLIFPFLFRIERVGRIFIRGNF